MLAAAVPDTLRAQTRFLLQAGANIQTRVGDDVAGLEVYEEVIGVPVPIPEQLGLL